MGQYLSFPGLLLGIYGLWRAFKRKEPTGWVEPGDEPLDDADDEDDDDDDDDDADDESNEPGSRSKPSRGDASDDEEEGDDEAEKASADPDVEAEFEGGKLKKQR
jgi:hypothetical protein